MDSPPQQTPASQIGTRPKSPSTTLVELPTDVLSEITAYLAADAIYSLIVACNQPLRYKLTHGGVHTLHYLQGTSENAEHEFCYSTPHFPWLRLEYHGTPAQQVKRVRFDIFAQLKSLFVIGSEPRNRFEVTAPMQLPPSLTHLEWYYHAFPWTSLTLFSTQLPNLRHLSIGTPISTETALSALPCLPPELISLRLRVEHVEELLRQGERFPRHLTSLTLTLARYFRRTTVWLEPTCLVHFPQLTSLQLPCSSFNGLAPEQSATWPRMLNELFLRDLEDTAKLKQLPPTLTSLHLVTRRTKDRGKLKSRDPWPPNLQKLTLTTQIGNVVICPPSVTHVRILDPKLFWYLEFKDGSPKNNPFGALGANCQILDFPNASFPEALLEVIPKQVKRVTLKQVSLEGLWLSPAVDKLESWNEVEASFFQAPRSFHLFTLMPLGPPHYRSSFLSIKNAENMRIMSAFYWTAVAPLPWRLVTLKFVRLDGANGSVIDALPAGLTELDFFQTSEDPPIDLATLFEKCPGLTSLSSTPTSPGQYKATLHLGPAYLPPQLKTSAKKEDRQAAHGLEIQLPEQAIERAEEVHAGIFRTGDFGFVTTLLLSGLHRLRARSVTISCSMTVSSNFSFGKSLKRADFGEASTRFVAALHQSDLFIPRLPNLLVELRLNGHLSGVAYGTNGNPSLVPSSVKRLYLYNFEKPMKSFETRLPSSINLLLITTAERSTKWTEAMHRIGMRVGKNMTEEGLLRVAGVKGELEIDSSSDGEEAAEEE